MRASPQYPASTHPGRQHGLTLVEMMIAMLIGLFLLIGTVTVYQQSRSGFRVSDSIARLQENTRYMLDLIEPDLRLAQFWGRSSEAGQIDPAIPVAVVVICDTVDTSAGMLPPTTYTAWALDIRREIWGVDETSGYGHATLGIPCAPQGGAQPQSDALVVRHASAQLAAPTAGVIQVHTDLTRGEFFNSGAAPGGYAATAQTHNVVTNVYYVSNTSDLDPTVPSLRVKTLIAGGIHQDQELMAGVENMQVQLGVDTDNDGEVERYVDPDHDIINPTTGGTIPDAQVIAARLWLLTRADRNEVGFTDNAQYNTPDPDVVINPCAPGGGCAYPNNFRRLGVSTTVSLRNNR
jgi:type IV pilus assembly protein PilW